MNRHWDDRFMRIAREVATWSKDPSTKCGCVIVDKHKNIKATGYNGFARYMDDSPERYADREAKLESVIHCEENAIINAASDLHGTTIYITGVPCPGCVSRIVQAGISSAVIAHTVEDAFYYREDDTYERWYDLAVDQLCRGQVYLRVLEPTDFNVELLMGTQHPYFYEER